LYSLNHEAARSLEPVVLTATNSCEIRSEAFRGSKISGKNTPAMLESERAAHRHVNFS